MKLNKHKFEAVACPIQPFLSAWMVISGVGFIIITLQLICFQTTVTGTFCAIFRESTDPESFIKLSMDYIKTAKWYARLRIFCVIFETILIFFWWIFGCILAFPINSVVQHKNKEEA